MSKYAPDNNQMQNKLLQESLWNLEDKLNIILEGTADHDAELIRLKRLSNQILDRLAKVNIHVFAKHEGDVEHD